MSLILMVRLVIGAGITLFLILSTTANSKAIDELEQKFKQQIEEQAKQIRELQQSKQEVLYNI
jgi:sensor domain CHASE-containing protein